LRPAQIREFEMESKLENGVIHVRMIGGFIGLFALSPERRLNRKMAEATSDGWQVIQIIPATSGNYLIPLLRLILLGMTLFLYTTADGYYLVLKKKY